MFVNEKDEKVKEKDYTSATYSNAMIVVKVGCSKAGVEFVSELLQCTDTG